MNIAHIRTRWAAVGAAVAISLGAGGIGITHATTSSGEKPIYLPINPCRLADLRPAPNTVGPRTAGLGPDEVYTLKGWGNVGACNLPSGTSGLALNVTAVSPTAPTFLRVWPADGAQPTTSNLNPSPGQPPTPNSVNVGLSAAGEFSVFNRFGIVNVIIDVIGVYDDHNHDDRYYTKTQTDAALATKADTTELESARADLTPQRVNTGEAFTLPPFGCAIVFVYGVGGLSDAGKRIGFWIENADGSMPVALDNLVIYKTASIGRTSQGGTLAWGEFCSLSTTEKSVPAGWVVKTTAAI